MDQLKERILTAAEFSVQLDSVNSMLEYEAEVLDAIDVRDTIIRLMEDQEKLREQIQSILED
jgi:hypothetical protein